MSYHLVTKTVVEYNSAEQAGSKTNISPPYYQEDLTDEPRQYEGLVFYSMGASSMGSTGLFKFNPESYVKKMDGYITSVSAEKVVAMYEGIGAAVTIEGYDRGTLRTKIAKAKYTKDVHGERHYHLNSIRSWSCNHLEEDREVILMSCDDAEVVLR
jgi:hypothetical protein